MVERHNILDPHNSTDVWDQLRNERKWLESRAIRWEEMGGGTLAVWVPRFRGDDDWVDEIAKALRGRQSVVVDLRGNHGGSVDQLARFLGLFYDENIPAARFVERRKVSEFKVKGKGSDRFEGKVIVLIDAASASASELFARTIQVTQRGTVLGDRSAGAVRVSRTYVHASGTQTAAFYGVNVTVSDVIMPDGGVLEGVGVGPDETILPTGNQMKTGADPVLARALALLGVTMTAEQAGLHKR
jgi:carboxyl-terminal processing protease